MLTQLINLASQPTFVNCKQSNGPRYGKNIDPRCAIIVERLCAFIHCCTCGVDIIDEQNVLIVYYRRFHGAECIFNIFQSTLSF